jgi:hypothetical protein
LPSCGEFRGAKTSMCSASAQATSCFWNSGVLLLIVPARSEPQELASNESNASD